MPIANQKTKDHMSLTQVNLQTEELKTRLLHSIMHRQLLDPVEMSHSKSTSIHQHLRKDFRG